MSLICIHNATVVAGYAQMPDSAVLIDGDRITDVFSERRFRQKRFAESDMIIDAGQAYVMPGLIDTHIHGFGGFGTEDVSTTSILKMSELLAQHGVSSFIPTIYPMSIEDMIKGIRAITAAMGFEKGATILGIHLEGPFISPARLGVQRPEFVKPVNLDLMAQLYEASEGHVISMTVAPELKGMRELALYCIKMGIVLQAGHTNATYENIIEGMQAGIRHSTHMFNAMSQLHHRNPNAVGAILIQPDLSCEIIADGRHVHPDLVRLLVRDKPDTNIVLITDALKPTKQIEGPFLANNEEVYLNDKLFYRKSDNVIAGSSLTMLEGLRNLVSYGISLESAVKMASSNPARIHKIGKRGELSPGFIADLTIMSRSFEVMATMVNGKFVFSEAGNEKQG
ncbi:MAG: N-acetylglucosamine-6-phosphate deacetylase [Spirochaetaceae bacterium]|nr:N-acetylglucosamine-6-phosphate deacetylase [Spirochaetaceae bacterium]